MGSTLGLVWTTPADLDSGELVASLRPAPIVRLRSLHGAFLSSSFFVVIRHNGETADLEKPDRSGLMRFYSICQCLLHRKLKAFHSCRPNGNQKNSVQGHANAHENPLG